MKIHLIAVGSNMPTWVDAGFQAYAQRLSQDVKLHLIEINAGVRGKNANHERILADEGKRLLQAIPKACLVVGLDVKGKAISTPQLAVEMNQWLHSGKDVAILIGGPEGFDPVLNQYFDQCLSLSQLTFPHPLVRILLAEQLYRAWSILHHHPYHRA